MASTAASPADPHAGGPLLTAGPAPEAARATLILVHGRGGSAEDMLGLYEALALEGLAAVAPQAAGRTWYPQRFVAPLEQNQPYLDSALRRIADVVEDLMMRGVSAERIALLGFSQGACLALDFAARTPRRYGGVMGLCGGLIGPPGTRWGFSGSLAGTPVFLGASDPDPHIPYERVLETEEVLRRMGAAVEVRRYPGMPHAVNADELDACRAMLSSIINAT